MYRYDGFLFCIRGGIAALIMRAELFSPGMQYVSGAQFNELFSLRALAEAGASMAASGVRSPMLIASPATPA